MNHPRHQPAQKGSGDPEVQTENTETERVRQERGGEGSIGVGKGERILFVSLQIQSRGEVLVPARAGRADP